MRRILYYSLLCLLWVSVNSCNDDEVSEPPKPAVNVDKSTGLLGETEFTFTVDQVGANSISLLPYGTDFPSLGGVLIPASAFTNGKATVKFTYARVGTFQAVAVANNHTGDGSNKNSVSDPKPVTITSNKASLKDFSFDKSTDTKVDETDPALTKVTITIPWSRHNDVSKLKLRFTKADYKTKTTLGTSSGTAVQSDTTEIDYSTPKTIVATSQDGSKSASYQVSIVQTPAETNTDFKSFGVTIAKKGKIAPSLKVATGRTLPGYVDKAANNIVLYDTLHSKPDSNYDSLAIDYALDGKFSYARYQEANYKQKFKEKLAGKDTINLTGNPLSQLDLRVTAEDSTTEDWKVYLAEAPKLTVTFPAPLNPTTTASSNENFAVGINVFTNTVTSSINSEFSFTLPAATTISQVKIVGGADDGTVSSVGPVFVLPGIDYSKPITLEATVNTTGLPTYVVSYTITVTTLK